MTTVNFTTKGKILLSILVTAILIGIYFYLKSSGVIKEEIQASSKVENIILPTAPRNYETVGLQSVQMPSNVVSTMSSQTITIYGIPWNAASGLNFANGGSLTTEGSIAEANNLKLSLERKDDYVDITTGLVKFAESYANGGEYQGAQFAYLMGGGAASFLYNVNKNLEKLREQDERYFYEIYGSAGMSDGEDKFMVKPNIKSNPKLAKGALFATVVTDDDWNIMMKWLSDNGTEYNPDFTTYDPDAANVVNCATFDEVAKKLIAGYTEDREIVKNGKRTGEIKKNIPLSGGTTWTPGDVDVAFKKGGFVNAVTTREYSSQMAAVIIGLNKFTEENPEIITNLLNTIFQGGDQVKTYSNALNKAGEINAKVFKQETGEWWVKYFHGIDTVDKMKNKILLGGSRVMNLGDNLDYFGVAEGSENIFAAVYTSFGNICKKYYPNILPEFPEANKIINTKYLTELQTNYQGRILEPTKPTFVSGEIKKENIVSKRDYSIEFKTNSAEILQTSEIILEKIYEQLLIAGNLKIDLIGHTDNTGSSSTNLPLSKQRAEAVKRWFQNKSNMNFPNSRFTVTGVGDSQPIDEDVNSIMGRSKNRRCTIILGSK